jgi:2-polyprenyl-3-methyl-5-hydroxy-6-metoxy-1,4-benzoquinol methylase
MDKVCECVPFGCSVFDLGCGTGAMLLELIATRQIKEVGGCEVSAQLLDTSRLAVKEILGIPGEFFQSNQPPESIKHFDCVTLIDVLHHIPRDLQSGYLKNVALNMKPGARFVLKDIDASTWLVWFNRLHDAVFAGNGYQELGMSCAEELLSKSGFIVERKFMIRRLWYPHYFIIAIKPLEEP